jgi:hypothetical protein
VVKLVTNPKSHDRQTITLRTDAPEDSCPTNRQLGDSCTMLSFLGANWNASDETAMNTPDPEPATQAGVVAVLMDVLDRPPERRPRSPLAWATTLLQVAGAPGRASPSEVSDVNAAAAYRPTIPTEEGRPPLDTTPEADPPKRRPSRSRRLSIGAAFAALATAAALTAAVLIGDPTRTRKVVPDDSGYQHQQWHLDEQYLSRSR